MGNFNTPYDDSFRTLLNECPRLVVGLVNELFNENRTGSDKVVLHNNELFITSGTDKKRITDTNISFNDEATRYHIECQSSEDGTIVVRIFEYASQVAIATADTKDPYNTVFTLPKSGILYLRCAKKCPREHTVTVNAPNGKSVTYVIPVVFIHDYSVDELFEKDLLFLLPFHFFMFDMNKLNKNKVELERVAKLYQNIWSRLEDMVNAKQLTEYERQSIKAMCSKVATALAGKYKEVKKGVETIMGGKILEYEARTIKETAEKDAVKKNSISNARSLFELGVNFDIIRMTISLDAVSDDELNAIRDEVIKNK